MVSNYATIIERCSPSTLLFPGHDYSLPILGILWQSFGSGATNPGTFLSLASHLFTAIHRRGVGDQLINIPIRLDDERRINPFFRMLRSHQRKIALPIYKAMMTRKEEEANKETKEEEEAPVTEAQQILTVTHETARNPLMSVYSSDFFELQAKLANNQVSSEEAAELMKTMARNVFRPVSAPRAQKDLTLLESITILGQKVPDHMEETGLNVPYKEVVHRERLAKLIEDFDPTIGEFFNTSVWTQGSYLTAKPLEKFISGGLNGRREEMPALLTSRTDDAKKTKWERLGKVKSFCSGLLQLGKQCNCKKTEDRLKVPESRHRAENCQVCSRAYKWA